MLKRLGLGWLVLAALGALLASAGGAGARTDGATRGAQQGPRPINFSPTAATAAALGLGSGQLRVGGQQGPSSSLSNVSPHCSPIILPCTTSTTPVMPSTTVYAIFWVPPSATLSTAYRNAVTSYFTNFAAQSGTTGNVYGVLPEYSVPGGTTVKYSVHFGGSYVATDLIPKDAQCMTYYPTGGAGLFGCVTKAQEETEVSHVLNVKHWTSGLTKLYFLFTPQAVGTCFNDYSYCSVTDQAPNGGYCGYHDFIVSNSSPTVWANIPYPIISGVDPTRCDSGAHPNSDPVVDATLSVVSQEHMGAITDPEPGLGGWFDDSTGEEISAKCTGDFGLTLGSTGTGIYNQVIGSGRYHLQQEWSNAASGCVAHGSQPALALSSFSPASGPAGTTVTINGKGFLDTTEVTLNGSDLTYNVTSPTTIQFKVPPDATVGTISVTANGTATSVGVFKPLPKLVAHAAVRVGSSDQILTLAGTNLSGATALTLGPVPLGIDTNSATQITTIPLPLNIVTGPLKVTTPGGTATITLGVAPTIDTIPASAAAGKPVTITGKTLGAVTKVAFGSPTATGTITTKTLTTVTVTVPPSALTGHITVTNSGGSTDSADTFHVVPSLSSISPTSGAFGTQVSINGSGLANSSSVVFTGSSGPAPILSHTATKVVVTVPNDAAVGPLAVHNTTDGDPTQLLTPFKPLPKLVAHAAVRVGSSDQILTLAGTNLSGATALTLGPVPLGIDTNSATQITTIPLPLNIVTGPLKVTTPGGTATITLGVAPTIDTIPASAAAGKPVTITGKTLGAVTKVAFGSPTATGTITTKTLTTVTVTVPPSALTGHITVTNSGGSTDSADTFHVVPSLSSISPTSGAFGTQVSINGSGLANSSSVVFTGSSGPAPILSHTATKVVVTVPNDAAVGPLAVHNTTDGDPTQLLTPFKPLPKLVAHAAVRVGSSDQILTLAGTNLSGATALTLGPVPLGIDTNSATQITTIPLPLNIVTGPLKVTTPGGTATITLGVAPTIDTIPASGFVGDPITITGKTFSGTTKVTFGSPTATASFSLVSSTTMKATVPSSAVTGPITITNAGGSTASSSFSVTPKITSFSPSSGPVLTTKVKIKGSGLGPSPTVTFNSTPATSFTLKTQSEIDVFVPTGAITGKINVQTAGGAVDSATDFTVTGTLLFANAYSAGSPRSFLPG